MSSCFKCKHFMQHRKVEKNLLVRGNKVEVFDIGGSCRCYPPKAHWLTGKAVFPYVLTGQCCSKYETI